MDSDRLPSTPENQAIGLNSVVERRVCYVEPASAVDVMLDQLQYLLGHDGRTCPIGCNDCVRLKQVERWLLQPFRSSGRRALRPRQSRSGRTAGNGKNKKADIRFGPPKS